MAVSQAEMLVLLLRELEHFDERIAALARSNLQFAAGTRAHIIGCFDRIAKHDRSEERASHEDDAAAGANFSE